MSEQRTGRIDVYEPCSCEVCADPRSRWFACKRVGERFVCEYECDGVDGTQQPTRESIAYVSAQHPGAVLVYIG